MIFWADLKFPSSFYFTVLMEQLTTLSVEPGDKDSTARYLTSLKSEPANEKAA
jgi:hypothetical protein